MTILAAFIHLESRDLLTWLVIGLVAGWLAGMAMRGGGFGLLGDLALGLAGAVVGGLLFGNFSDGPQPLASTAVVAFMGACILLLAARMVAPRRLEA